MENQMPPVQVYAESTPNPATMKYVCNRPLLPDASVEYSDISQTKSSPLAEALFQFPFIKAVYIKNNFVTVTKVPVIEWMEIMHELRDFIIGFLNDGKVAVKEVPPPAEKTEKKSVSHELPLNPTEAEAKIIEILDEIIKPAVEQDGGEIAFKSFEDGTVTVVMRGSCSGCPSSTLTLKAGIEQLLKREVPGVESVVAENE